ncbi:MAG: FHA domain-containing protein [Armatimonadetes bacterium]|nr:FHA domain-containing protein [Armatimonadota bacterium]
MWHHSPANPWPGSPNPAPSDSPDQRREQDQDSSWPQAADAGVEGPPAESEGPAAEPHDAWPAAPGTDQDAAAAWGVAPQPPAVPGGLTPSPTAAPVASFFDPIAPPPKAADPPQPPGAAGVVAEAGAPCPGGWDLGFDAPPASPAPAAPAPQWVLDVSVGSRHSQYTLAEGTILVGRPDPKRGVQPQIDLRPDDTVSRRHAQIVGRGGRYYVVDLGSTNGSFVNQQAISPHVEVEIRPGDEITLGELARIRVRLA